MNRHAGMTPGQANATKRKHADVHQRDREDNESTACGSREGAASLNPNDVTCPRCRGRED